MSGLASIFATHARSGRQCFCTDPMRHDNPNCPEFRAVEVEKYRICWFEKGKKKSSGSSMSKAAAESLCERLNGMYEIEHWVERGE